MELRWGFRYPSCLQLAEGAKFKCCRLSNEVSMFYVEEFSISGDEFIDVQPAKLLAVIDRNYGLCTEMITLYWKCVDLHKKYGENLESVRLGWVVVKCDVGAA